jgi:protein-S-isoprenylcysteine O-methyltransferase Ste14
MDAALLFPACGAHLENISPASSRLIALAGVALFLTARRDEEVCKNHFGAEYVDYMRRTRLFVPFVF